jgi:small subunit ribosomal protein S16
MAVRIRLARYGKRNSPFYRVVIQDREKPRNGRFLEIVGTYDPKQKSGEKRFDVKKERVEYWLGKGATPSETVAKLIKSL